ncbi:DUF2779 domain-containing protein [Ramlibacter sp. MAHUQ-53]|uniref:DUF2779 domain-containing protein n=1 Tax=unclassified Ramlibacter TaxID=2617605 RepID=UPI003630FD2C
MLKPLTKSRFKIALECPTKLYYESRPGDYRNQMRENAFLAALADGGHQVGTLAKFKYHPDPIGQAITVEANGYDESVAQTHQRLAVPGRVVVAEAALRHDHYFVRVDLLIRDQERKRIELIEVKSKGVSEQDVAGQFTDKAWRPYLYDVAFQAEVASRVFPGWQIVPKLVLMDKSVACDVEALHQQFPVVFDADGRNARVEVAAGLDRAALGSLDILREVDVSDLVQGLRAAPVDVTGAPPEQVASLPAFMAWAAGLQHQEIRHFGGMSKACKDCQYRATEGDPLRSGVHECLEEAIRRGLLDTPKASVDRSQPLAIDLWGAMAGRPGIAQRVLQARRALLADVQEQDIAPARVAPAIGFTPLERRLAQVRAVREPDFSFEIREDRLAEMDRWEWPLHMIDFETSAPAVPFFKGTRPHETLAFQFSHHVMEKDAAGHVTIRHASQWICTDAGVFPSIEFVRQLRAALMPQGRLMGTVFRYHFHENSVLRKLRPLVAASAQADAPELIAFIDLITGPGEGADAPAREMVDLHRLVQEGYYSARAGGSVSLKYMLPAILNDAPGLRQLYARAGIYGRGLPIASLNFDGTGGHVWLQDGCGGDPYKTLPPIFGAGFDALDAMLLRLRGSDGEDGAIAHGGAAMTAYNYTQFSRLAPAQRQEIEAALLRYCELDTLAMVMLVQGLMELRGRPLPLAGLGG